MLIEGHYDDVYMVHQHSLAIHLLSMTRQWLITEHL